MKHSEHGSKGMGGGQLKHCGPGMDACRPAPKHLMPGGGVPGKSGQMKMPAGSGGRGHK